MRKILLFLALLCAPVAFGQGGGFIPLQTATNVLTGRPIPNATITVCAAGALGSPCNPPAINAIFSDLALTKPLSNPFLADNNGNYQFAAAVGTFTVSVTAQGFNGYSYQVTVPSTSPGAVQSVFGRTGSIAAQTGDYTAAQITGAVANTTTVAGHPLSGNVAIACGDLTNSAPGCSNPNVQPSSNVFIAATSCNGYGANCVQWIDDDATDNCGTATTNWIAAINAAGTSGYAQVFIYGSGSGKAFLLKTCQLKFGGTGFLRVTINCTATLDAGTNSSANLIQFGDGTHGGIYDWYGCTFIGGASLTVAGIETTANTGKSSVQNANWLNFGAGNATLGTCTNYSIKVDAPVAESYVIGNFSGMSDNVTGRCFAINVGGVLGQNTVYFLNNVVGGQSGSFCAGIGIADGGYYGSIANNNIGNIAVPIEIFGGGHRVFGNQLDTEGCTSGNGVNAVINYGVGVGGSVDGVTIEDNVAQFGGSHATNFLQAFHSGATMSNMNLIGNTQSVTTSTTAQLVGGLPVNCGTTNTGQYSFCLEIGNNGLVPVPPCASGGGSFSTGWQHNNKIAYCQASTAGANIGTTALITVPNSGSLTPIYIVAQSLVTAAATTSGGTLPQVVISYTDFFTNVAETVIVTPVAAASAVGCTSTPAFSANMPLGYSCQGTIGPLFVKGNTTVNYSTINYAAGVGTAMVAQAAVSAYID